MLENTRLEIRWEQMTGKIKGKFIIS